MDLEEEPSWLHRASLAAALLLGAAAGAILALSRNLPDISQFQEAAESGPQSTKLLDARGRVVSRFEQYQRTVVELDQIPLFMQQGIIATEDQRFYHHFGLDPEGILRAGLNNLRHGKAIEGGSTITQQLAKNIFLTNERTWRRKIREAILAIRIEREYTKAEILKHYLNWIFFGAGAYGVEAAARTYFGKHVSDLNLAEAALLAGLPKGPSAYNPYQNPLVAQTRQRWVLDRMVDEGYITPLQAEQAKAAPLELKRAEVEKAPYFVEHVRRILEAKYGTALLLRGGLTVDTTLDLDIQAAAQASFEEGLKKAEEQVRKSAPEALATQPLQGSMLVLDPRTGGILAMIGGRDFREFQYNLAVQAQRQPGSSFKPFVYAAAFDSGLTPADIELDQPKTWPMPDGRVWSPANFVRGEYRGKVTLRDGLRRSLNIVAVRLIERVGVDRVVRLARKLGIESPLKPELGLALGTSEVNLLELTSAYGAFANGGVWVPSVAILRVRDNMGKILEENNPEGRQALSPRTTYVLVNVMKDVLDHPAGTGHLIRRLGFSAPAAGKTGTNENNIDAWFVGFTPEMTCGIWFGFDNRASMGPNQVGGSIAAPVFARFMNRLPRSGPAPDFPRPTGLEDVEICSASGLRPASGCPANLRKKETFILGSAPEGYCDVHGGNLNIRDLDREDYGGATPSVSGEPASSQPTALPSGALSGGL